MDNYVRIWNERSKNIGGVGADFVIHSLKSAGIQARSCESEFRNHEGIEVPMDQVHKASYLVEKKHGRPG